MHFVFHYVQSVFFSGMEGLKLDFVDRLWCRGQTEMLAEKLETAAKVKKVASAKGGEEEE